MVETNKVLIRVNLNLNNMGDQTGQELIRAINHNDRIELLEIENNQISMRFVDFVV
jgi:hypothetical protein